MAPSPITAQHDFDDLVGRLGAEGRYALDTEFHRERTYYPKLAVLQLAWAGGVAVVDALAVDVSPLAKVLDGPGVAVVHAAQQDLEVLARACGTVPARMFDTQLAAGFLGHATPSLATLLASELKVRLPKADRLTDWLRRPLTADQIAYAAADVEHLLALHDTLVDQLERRGRLGWALDECELARTRPTGPADPASAWLRIKDHRHLRGASRGVARELAAWRERRAAELDIPPRFVLADLAVLSLAQRPPRTADELRAARGAEDRHAKGRAAEEILAAVAAGLALGPHAVAEPVVEEAPRELRPAVTLVSAWVSQLARDLDLDTGLLATRADIVSLLAGDPSSRLSHGWRADVVGDHIGRLVEGRAALAFDGRRGLRLVPVPPEGAG